MKNWILLLIVLIAVPGCKKPFDPPVIISPQGYLVVEGIINSGSDSTLIKMSRTVGLNGQTNSRPELHAILTVQGDNNTAYPLIELGNGRYGCPGLNLDNKPQYRLQIKTTGNEVYQSAYLPVLNSPPIDSVSYDTKGKFSVAGLNIYVSTHDPTGKVAYYRWAYSESWIFHTGFESNFYSDGYQVLLRNHTTQNITYCWGADSASSINLASTAKLSQDLITQKLLTSIVSSSEKMEDKYSILVTQYALSADAYNFYSNIQKNTENLGSIFDALPSAATGNIICATNPSEPVIGFISVGASTAKRIFITNNLLPAWSTKSFYDGCRLIPQCCLFGSNGPNQVDDYINYDIGGFPNPYIPIDQLLEGPDGPVIGYSAATRECADCTLRGTNIQPVFWQ